MSGIEIGLLVAATAASAASAISTANAQKAQSETAAQASDYNAAIGRNSEISANQQVAAQEDSLRRSRRIALGNARASISQTGLMDTGSILDSFDQSAISSELDILNTRYEGNAKARSIGEGVNLDIYSAASNRIAGRQAQSAGYLNAGSALLSGASSGYSAYKTNQFQGEQRAAWKKQGLM